MKKNDLKICFLVLCHKNEEQLRELIGVLDSKNTFFYIHIDKSSDMNFSIQKENVIVLPFEDRVSVKWGDRSMVDATMHLMEAALQGEFDYYYLISGQDFPIKPLAQLEEFLGQNNGKDFVHFYTNNQLNDPEYRRYSKRNDLYYPPIILKNTFVSKVLKKAYIIITGGPRNTIVKRKHKSYKHFYYGSQWWCLTKESVRKVYVELSKNDWIYDDLYQTNCPDECFVQTILYNDVGHREMLESNLTYFDFTNQKRSPNVLDERWYDTLRNSNKFLARKFERGKSDKLIELIKNNLLK